MAYVDDSAGFGRNHSFTNNGPDAPLYLVFAYQEIRWVREFCKRLLNYSDILRRFIPSPVLDPHTLDDGVQACLVAKTACVGYEINQKVVNRHRRGNFWLDFLNFKRQVEIDGWRFSGMLLLVRDLVVYKLTGGQSIIQEQEDTSNPLGPLQGIGETTGALVR